MFQTFIPSLLLHRLLKILPLLLLLIIAPSIIVNMPHIALLGQHQMSPEQATTAGKMLDLPDDAVMLLQHVPYKGTGSIPAGQTVPTDPLIYRFYEMVMVYGSTYKELIHEEFGDGIMSAIDFKMDVEREPDPKGDRVKIVMSGKFLPYVRW